MQKELVSQWRELYDDSSGAASWLEAHRWDYGPQVALATIADVRSKLDLRPRDRVLEVGAGSGAFLMGVLHPQQPGVGLDLCESLVHASARLGVDRVRIKLGVAEGLHLPIPSESFDKVLCYSVAHHFPGPDYACGVVHELVRVCRVGGVVLLGDVCGVMERHRKALIQRGLPPRVAEGLLTTMVPFRYMRWLRARLCNGRWSSTYRRGFFERTLRSMACDYEILEQNIPGRKESRGRFDVRILKKEALRHAVAQFTVAVWVIVDCVKWIVDDMGILVHG